jgi:hypothetical protein
MKKVYHPSKETRIKISKTLKGHIVSIESRKKMSDSAKGKIISKETRKKISEANKGKHSMPCQEKTKIKLSKSIKEKWRDRKYRKKQILAWKEGRNKGMTGRYHSKETIRKMSKIKIGKKNPMYRTQPTKKTRKKHSKSLRLAWKEGRMEGMTGNHISKKSKRIHSKSLILAWKNGKMKGTSGKRYLNKRHRTAVLEEIKKYQKQGFKVLNTDKIHPDFIVRMGNKDRLYAVEVEITRQLTSDDCVHKYDGINIFDDIHWIKRERKR